MDTSTPNQAWECDRLKEYFAEEDTAVGKAESDLMARFIAVVHGRAPS
ncbi:MAG TPA: hypothetical protein VFE46_03685 [Pirellulales bacterium]|jgi:hypothetical protein|nr:hypothetical protein [Pirellulales bacterium]